MTTMKMRDKAIDSCKGLAMVLVVVGHVVGSYQNTGMFLDSGLMNYVMRFVFSFHMPLFFVISGWLAGMKGKEEPLAGQLIKKLAAYGIPYLAFSLLHWGLKSVCAGLVNTKVSFTDLLMIPVQSISYFWFLYALLIISVIHIVVVNRIHSEKIKRGVLLGAALLLRVLAWCAAKKWFGELDRYSGMIFFDVAKYMIWYELGACFLTAFRGAIRRISCYILIPAYALLVYAAYHFGFSNLVVDFILASVGIASALQFCQCMQNVKGLLAVGQRTMPVYLLHGYVISACRMVLSRLLPLSGNGWAAAALCICTSFGILVPLAFYYAAQRIKPVDFLFYPCKYLKRVQGGKI